MNTTAHEPRLRRRWILSPLAENESNPRTSLVHHTEPDDDPAIAELLDAAYVGTIDHDPDTDHLDELRTWREVDHADDTASYVCLDREGTRLVAASLIGRELSTPILYEIVVHPNARRRGLGRQLLQASVARLGQAGDQHLAAWVTHGNTASERLLTGLGFRPTTAPLGREAALMIYRAASAIGRLDRWAPAVYWAGAEAKEPVLWVIGESAPDRDVDCGRSTVRVRFVDRDTPILQEIAQRATPVTGADLHRQASRRP